MNSLDFWQKPGFDKFDHMMNNFFRAGMMPPSLDLTQKGMGPACELSETAHSYRMRVDLPGLKKEDIKIAIDDNRLTVSGDRKEEIKEKDEKQHSRYSEVRYGSFSQSYTFPAPIDSEKVEAKYADGVLSLRIKKAENTQAKQIAIQ